MPIENLSVLFPDDEIRFGSISPGATSEYQDVPNGVYAYAAYHFEIDGEMILQPVIDWVGERPLDGDTFTYVLTFSPNQPLGQMVRLMEVINE